VPIIDHDKKIEPKDDSEIWRFLRIGYFRDLFANQELYFRRTDLYKTDDAGEGLPTDEYLRKLLNLNHYLLSDELKLNHHQASNRLHNESHYLSCWNLNDPDNRLRMWYRYAPFGVAVRSDYGRVKRTLDQFLDKVHVGCVRYGDSQMTGYNVLQILFTKSAKYSWENEIRAVVCSYDPVGGQSRNYRERDFPYREPQDDIHPLHPWVHECKRRRIRIEELVTNIAVSPWAPEDIFNEVQESWANVQDCRLPVSYDLSSTLTPTIEALRQQGWGKRGSA